jgi:hypothetical protein
MTSFANRLLAAFAYLLCGWQVGLALTLCDQRLDRPAYFWVPILTFIVWPMGVVILSQGIWDKKTSGRWLKTLIIAWLIPLLAAYAFHVRQAGSLAGVWSSAFEPYEGSTSRVWGLEPPGAASTAVQFSHRQMLEAAWQSIAYFALFVVRITVATPLWLVAAFVLAGIWPTLRGGKHHE